MKLWSILGNSQKLDGGAMFGNAPKAVWSKWLAPDSDNRVPLACRALLVDGIAGKRVLFETGIGAFFEPKVKERYGVVESEHVLLESLARAGYRHEDVDAVVLSHLHFDHSGGLFAHWEEGQKEQRSIRLPEGGDELVHDAGLDAHVSLFRRLRGERELAR